MNPTCDRRPPPQHANDQETCEALLQETFDRVLSMFPQLGLHHQSPKLFIIYAHDNDKAGFEAFEAHQGIVQNYITWFKNIRFNVDSDRSPHGYGPSHAQAHPGASSDIITNQICLLPTSWHPENVDYVLIFYSKLLAKYMKDEREYKDQSEHEAYSGKTFTEALFDICKERKYQPPSHAWRDAVEAIRKVQKHYEAHMKSKGVFHHALTELALLRYRNSSSPVKYTVPIILCGSGDDHKDWEPDLKWDPIYISAPTTTLRKAIQPGQEFQRFFKILQEFETLEVHRRLLEVMSDCFTKTTKLLTLGLKPKKYRNQLEVNIHQGLQDLNLQWEKIERPVTAGHIRDSLKLFSEIECSSLQRVSGENLPRDLCDIDLAVVENQAPEADKSSGDKSSGNKSSDNKAKKAQVIPLHRLFEERKVNTETIRPRRILIQGKPGIGKTTLSRRLMREYYWHEELQSGFDFVIRIPVRKLDQSTNLSEILFDEYFHTLSKGRDLAQKLEEIVLSSDFTGRGDRNDGSRKNILVILDGLDELRGGGKANRLCLRS